MTHRSNGRRRTKLIVLSAIGTMLLVQAGFSFVLPWWHPDTEYRLRKELIQARVAEQPEKPLLVMVGSSRVTTGFDPQQFSDFRTADGRPILSFNFGHLESGPVSNLVQVKRLLRTGIKPRWLIVEVAPMWCANEWNSYVHNLSWEDVGTVAHYHSYRKFTGSFLRNHFLVPWFRHRGDLQERYLHETPKRPVQWNLSAYGWGQECVDVVPPDLRRQWTENAHRLLSTLLTDQFQIAPITAGAYRELLALCRKEGIEVALLIMPEGNTYRSWYSPVAEERLQTFLKELSVEYRVPIFDTRPWFDDSFFADSHHLTLQGGRQFSRRLEREILQPWILGTSDLARPPAEVANRSHLSTQK